MNSLPHPGQRNTCSMLCATVLCPPVLKGGVNMPLDVQICRYFKSLLANLNDHKSRKFWEVTTSTWCIMPKGTGISYHIISASVMIPLPKLSCSWAGSPEWRGWKLASKRGRVRTHGECTLYRGCTLVIQNLKQMSLLSAHHYTRWLTSTGPCSKLSCTITCQTMWQKISALKRELQ